MTIKNNIPIKRNPIANTKNRSKRKSIVILVILLLIVASLSMCIGDDDNGGNGGGNGDGKETIEPKITGFAFNDVGIYRSDKDPDALHLKASVTVALSYDNLKDGSSIEVSVSTYYDGELYDIDTYSETLPSWDMLTGETIGVYPYVPETDQEPDMFTVSVEYNGKQVDYREYNDLKIGETVGEV